MGSLIEGPWSALGHDSEDYPPEPPDPDPDDDEQALSAMREDDSYAAHPVWVAYGDVLGERVVAAFTETEDAARFSADAGVAVQQVPLYRKGEYPWPAPSTQPQPSPSS